MDRRKEPSARIFVCTYEKEGRCKSGEGEKCAAWIKAELKERGLKSKVWATRTGCQGYCDPKGCSVIYVKGIGKPLRQYSGACFDEFTEKTERFIKSLD